MQLTDETRIKLERVRAYLAARGARGLLLASTAGFAWITGGGRSHVSVSGDAGVGAVLVTLDETYLIANNIELDRLREEEGADGFVPVSYPWWSGSIAEEALRIVPAVQLVADVPFPDAQPFGADGVQLRNPLLPEEVERYRCLGEDIGVVLTHVAFQCRPALMERQLAGMLAKGCVDFGIDPVVTLVAVDERTRLRRHPLPTEARLQNYALLVVTGRRHGLHVSATRAVHFGAPPADLADRHTAAAHVDATLLAASTPGASLGDALQAGLRAYAENGFPDEWTHHHQGGPTGYASRDVKATPQSREVVLDGQAFAWNPTVAGAKSEDTALITATGAEIVSRTPDLPELAIEVAGRTFIRPGILTR